MSVCTVTKMYYVKGSEEPQVTNPVGVETEDDGFEYVKWDYNANVKKEHTIGLATRQKLPDHTRIVINVENGYFVYLISKLQILQNPAKVQKKKRVRSGSAHLDSAREAMEDAEYIAKVNKLVGEG